MFNIPLKTRFIGAIMAVVLYCLIYKYYLSSDDISLIAFSVGSFGYQIADYILWNYRCVKAEIKHNFYKQVTG